MKHLLLIQLLLSVTIANAKNYYLSSSGNNSNNGTSPLTAWQTIAKINATNFSAGDSILFKRGEVFYGSITPSANRIIFASYDKGANPVITGLTNISSWTNLGNNIWEATVPGGLSTLSTVIINGQLTPMGRYPNAGSDNAGYLTYTSWVDHSSVTNAALTGSPNFSGGEVVIREQGYATDRATITSQSGSTINYTTTAKESMMAGFGFFIQNHPATLDIQNEWYYYNAGNTKKLRIYSLDNPGTIQVATLASLVNMTYTSNTLKTGITISGIDFIGSEGPILKNVYANNTTIDRCNFSFGGVSGIEYGFSNYLTVANCHFSDINMCGIYETYYFGVSNTLIKNNVLKRVGINPGMIAFTSPTYPEGNSSTGIIGGSDNLVIRDNTLDSIGYNGIALRQNRNNTLVRRNVLTNWCMVKNDGGGIYNVGQRGLPAAKNVVIDSNIVSLSVGEVGGTPFGKNTHVKGIYLDATSQAVNVLHNTVFNCLIGISISQAQGNVIKDNTVFNCGVYNQTGNLYSGQLNVDDGLAGFTPCRSNIITNNIFCAKTKDQLLYRQNDNFNRIDSIGIVDSNYNVMPFGDYSTHVANMNSVVSSYSFGYWRAKHRVYNSHSKSSPVKIPEFTYNTLSTNKAMNESFTSNITGALVSSTPVVHTLSWDNKSTINGVGCAKLTSSVEGPNFTSFYQIIGAIDASKSYILRFKTKATKVGSYKTYLQQWSGRYAIITSKTEGTIDTTIQQHEIAFSGEHSTEAKAALFIQFSQDNSTIFIDDIQFIEVSLVRNNNSDKIRFEYNATGVARTISLDAKYVGVDSTVYGSSVTLQPYSSLILFKTGNILKVDAGSDLILNLPVNSATLKGSANGNVSYAWSKISGPSQFTISSSTSASTVVSNLAAGSYTFLLKVTNSAGDTASATVKILVASVLPVKLSDFTAINNNNIVDVKWETSLEINVSHYVIERSSDGQKFESVGQVISNNRGTGVSNYTFEDNFPAAGDNFYRLAIIDKDGAVDYSKTVKISAKKVNSFSLVNLAIANAGSTIKAGINSNYQQSMSIVVTDISGKILVKSTMQLQKGFNALNSNIPSTSTGIYYIKMFTPDQMLSKAVLGGQ